MNKNKFRKAFVDEKICVACGCCVNICKLNAVSIYKGINAVVNDEKCVGCGRCAKECPAGCIYLKECETI